MKYDMKGEDAWEKTKFVSSELLVKKINRRVFSTTNGVIYLNKIDNEW